MTRSKDEAEWESSSLTSEVQAGEEAEKISPEILSGDSERKRQAVVTVSGEVFSGPLPHPKILKEYEQILPGIAERMVTIAESEQGIRSKDNTGLRKNDLIFILGSTVISFCLIAAIVFCAYIGQVWVSVVLGLSGLITTINPIDYFGKRRDSNK